MIHATADHVWGQGSCRRVRWHHETDTEEVVICRTVRVRRICRNEACGIRVAHILRTLTAAAGTKRALQRGWRVGLEGIGAAGRHSAETRR